MFTLSAGQIEIIAAMFGPETQPDQPVRVMRLYGGGRTEHDLSRIIVKTGGTHVRMNETGTEMEVYNV